MMKQVLKSTTALLIAGSLAMPNAVYAQGEADPQMEKAEQQERLENQAAAEKAAAAAALHLHTPLPKLTPAHFFPPPTRAQSTATLPSCRT